jgi:hypothetical protein
MLDCDAVTDGMNQGVVKGASGPLKLMSIYVHLFQRTSETSTQARLRVSACAA